MNLRRLHSRLIDGASFGFINALQLRRRLPRDYAAHLKNYCVEWSTRSIEEYYAAPPGFPPPAWPAGSRLAFPTPHPGPHPENNTAIFDLYPCDRGWSAPTMILAHGLMSVSDTGYRRWARRLNEKGWNAIFAHLPFHYERRPRGQWTGESAVGADLVANVEGVRQSVMEFRILLDLLEKQGGRVFGGWGTSYGGWIMAMLACVEPRLQRLVLVEPIINVEHAIWKSPGCVLMRHLARRAGVRKEDSDLHWRLCCPSFSTPRTPPEKIILLAGLYDAIAAPELIEDLHRRWAGSHYAAFEQGHVGYTLMPESFRLMQALWPEDFGGAAAADSALHREK